jgi:hypothetical protein
MREPTQIAAIHRFRPNKIGPVQGYEIYPLSAIKPPENRDTPVLKDPVREYDFHAHLRQPRRLRGAPKNGESTRVARMMKTPEGYVRSTFLHFCQKATDGKAVGEASI